MIDSFPIMLRASSLDCPMENRTMASKVEQTAIGIRIAIWENY